MLTAYKGRSFETDKTDTKSWGRWVESAVRAHLPSMAEVLDYKVFHWRNHAKSDNKKEEVDFIISNDGEIIAIEVKSRRRGMNSGLKSFTGHFNLQKALVAGTNGVSTEDFLQCNIYVVLTFYFLKGIFIRKMRKPSFFTPHKVVYCQNFLILPSKLNLENNLK
ncbi:MAG: DUF4143 domain-containing protein [Bacteroidaceae bacterium]|nr:DUF4143 domain-containing protein [Bacteroidaceae bacterium]